MLDIVLVTVGSVRDENLKALCAEYEKRARPFARLSVIEVKPEPFHDPSRMGESRRAEGERVIRALAKFPKESVWLLAENGAELDSVSFAREIAKSPAVFAVGGASGWGENILALGYHRFSLSRFTIPHELARLVFLEQLYRAGTILAGKRYHY